MAKTTSELFSKLGVVVWTLIGHAFKAATTYDDPRKELQQLFSASVDDIAAVEITTCIDLLTLLAYGDIDLLVFDHDKKIAYSIECKNITGGKTIYEMWSEISGYLEKDKTDNKAEIVKHANWDRWLQNNKGSLSYFVNDPGSYQVKSFVQCANEIPLTYLKKHQLPLPIKSFVFLRRKGIGLLDDLI